MVDSDHIVELFAAFGPVAVRRMFGGAGIFAHGVMIGLVADGAIYLRADTDSILRFKKEGMQPFRYETKNGARAMNTYWRMPERLYDDPDELAGWAHDACRAAQASRRKREEKPVRRGL